VSLNTQKSTILTNFCNPEIPGLGRRQSRDSGMVKTAGILGSRDCKHYLQHLSRWAQQLESDNIPKVCYLSRVGCFRFMPGHCEDVVWLVPLLFSCDKVNDGVEETAVMWTAQWAGTCDAPLQQLVQFRPQLLHSSRQQYLLLKRLLSWNVNLISYVN